MTTKSFTHSAMSPAYADWLVVAMLRVKGAVCIVAKRNRQPQGCFPMTD